MRWAVGELRGTLMEALGQDSGIPDTNLDLYISWKGNTKEMEWVLLMEYVWMTLFPDSLVAQRLNCLPGMRETWVRSLGREDPLQKEMATHSSTLTWRIPWREEPGRLQSMGSQRVGHDWATSLSLSLSPHLVGILAPQYFFLLCNNY